MTLREFMDKDTFKEKVPIAELAASVAFLVAFWWLLLVMKFVERRSVLRRRARLASPGSAGAVPVGHREVK
jgi:hypothetical protein